MERKGTTIKSRLYSGLDLPSLCDQNLWHGIVFSIQTENPAACLHCRSSQNCIVGIYSVARMPFPIQQSSFINMPLVNRFCSIALSMIFFFDIGEIDDVSGYNNLFSLLCLQIGNLVKEQELAVSSGLCRPTVKKYLFLLENTYFLRFKETNIVTVHGGGEMVKKFKTFGHGRSIKRSSKELNATKISSACSRTAKAR